MFQEDWTTDNQKKKNASKSKKEGHKSFNLKDLIRNCRARSIGRKSLYGLSGEIRGFGGKIQGGCLFLGYGGSKPGSRRSRVLGKMLSRRGDQRTGGEGKV